MKYTRINLQTLQDKDFILTSEKFIRRGLSNVMRDRYVKSDEIKKILNIDATNLYGSSTSQDLPFDVIEMWHGHPHFYMKKLGVFLNTPDDSYIDFFIEVGLRHPDNIKEKTKKFPFCPESKVTPKKKTK